MSTPQQQAKDLFVKLINEAQPEEWNARLAELCGEDEQLRTRVRALLQAHRDPESFLDNPAFEMDQTVQYEGAIQEQAGTTVGPYKLLQQIGEGGMGVVFMAEQTHPVQRRVALKIVKPGMDSRQVIARFEAERQALALMDHPNIAKVLDAGTTEGGRPYFVMELVKGVPVTEYCDQHKMTLEQRLELFMPVCQAVQHAHQKGVIHRDLKPSNVLIAAYDGKPVPKVIDFGVAKATGPKLTDKTMFTEFGSVIGTLEYMSPEQAELNQLDVDTRSDVYALGVLLYELLTGTTPLEKRRLKESALHEVLRFIREEEPPKPSTRLSTSSDLPAVASKRGTEAARLQGVVSGELDWIVMKSLEKDRGRRYESASSLSADIERYLSNEAVEACPPSAGYRFRKLARRNKAAIVTTGLVGASLLVGLATSLWQMKVAQRAESQARESLAEAVVARERADEAEALAQQRLASEQEARKQANKDAARAKEVSQFLTRALVSANPNSGNKAEYTVRELLDDFSKSELPRLEGQPELKAELHSLLGNAYVSLNLPEKANPQLISALKTLENVHEGEHSSVAKAKLNLAQLRRLQRKLNAAERLSREAWDSYQALGMVEEDAIESMHVLQLVMLERGDAEQALKVYAKAAEAASESAEPIASLANVIHDHARGLMSLNRLDEAEAMGRKAVKMHEQLHGDEHQETGWAKNILGQILTRRSKFEEAATVLTESLKVFEKTHSDSHFSIRGTASALRRALSEGGKTIELAKLVEKYPWLVPKAADFAVATGTFPVEAAKGKTIVFRGWIKTEDVEKYAALWWRADKPDQEAIAFDNMQERGPYGTTDWKEYKIELDIPEETTNINFGVLLAGGGRAWFDDLSVEIDGEPYVVKDYDLDFELEAIEGFYVPYRPSYQTVLDSSTAKSGKQSLQMQGTAKSKSSETVRLYDRTLLKEYAGRFEVEGQDNSIVVVAARGILWADVGDQKPITLKPVSLKPEDEGKFLAGASTIEFERDESGKVNRLKHTLLDKASVAKRWTPVEIDPAILDRYIGTYSYSEALDFEVTRQKDQLWVRLTNQGKMQVYPASDNQFYYLAALADIEFHTNDEGQVDSMTLHQFGMDIPAERTGDAGKEQKKDQ